jgi:hypothetical protein
MLQLQGSDLSLLGFNRLDQHAHRRRVVDSGDLIAIVAINDLSFTCELSGRIHK